MKSLQTIQKTFAVFEIIVRVARILAIVGACLGAAGILCAVVGGSGGRVISLFGQELKMFAPGPELKPLLGKMLSYTVLLCAQIFLLALAGRYFKTERADGTPFTAHGADLLKKLAIRCIYVPIVALIIAAVITVCLDVPDVDGIASNLPGLTVGLVLLLASFIFRYGAELEEKNRPSGDNTGVEI